MIVSCPKCGQHLKGDPGSIGACPKCQTRLQFPEGDSKIGEPITCPHCGQVQRYKDGKCISCGKSLTPNDSAKSSKHPKKKIVAIVGLVIVVSLLVLLFTPLKDKLFLTDEKKDEDITLAYIQGEYDEAMRLVVEYYGTTSSKALAWAAILTEAENAKIVDDLKVEDQSLVLDGNYYDYEAQIKNNSNKTVTYIKVNIYLYDEDGNMVNTEWTNWSGSLPPEGSTYIDTMIKDTGNIEKFKTEIAEVSSN